jgi:hypothetical protein
VRPRAPESRPISLVLITVIVRSLSPPVFFQQNRHFHSAFVLRFSSSSARECACLGTMADRVRFVMDRMAPLFKQLEQSGIFTTVSSPHVSYSVVLILLSLSLFPLTLFGLLFPPFSSCLSLSLSFALSRSVYLSHSKK